jgi:hypothetical protein
MPSTKRDVPLTNRLLAALPKKEYQRLLPQIEHVALSFGDILFEPGETFRHVYFPNDSIISLLSALEAHELLESGMVGNEGMAGLPVFMGVSKSLNRGLVQGAGTAMKMKAATLRKEINNGSSLHKLLLLLYTHVHNAGITIGSMHPVSSGQRAARSLAADDA